jgi:ferredoxin
MEVSIDGRRCHGHAVCWMNAPEVFDFDDAEGVGLVRRPHVPDRLEAAVQQAAANCPEAAIRLAEPKEIP